MAEQIQRAGAWCETHLATDGVTAEIQRQAVGAGAVAAGIDEDWFRSGTFGPGSDELLHSVDRPVLLVRAREGLTRRGLAGIIERIQGRGVEDRVTTEARLAAAGPAPTHIESEEGGH